MSKPFFSLLLLFLSTYIYVGQSTALALDFGIPGEADEISIPEPAKEEEKEEATKDEKGEKTKGKDTTGQNCPAKINSLAGKVQVKLVGGAWKKAEMDACLFGDDRVKTGKDSGVGLALSDGSTLKVAQLSQTILKGLKKKEDSKREVTGAEMTEGELWAEVAADKGAFVVTTPTGVVNVRGTEFSVRLDKDKKGEKQVQVFTLDGEVALSDKSGKSIPLPKGKAGRILGKALGEAFDFDLAAFEDYLKSWKDLLTPGGIRDFIKAKSFGMIQDKINESLEKVVPGGKLPGGLNKGKFGF